MLFRTIQCLKLIVRVVFSFVQLKTLTDAAFITARRVRAVERNQSEKLTETEYCAMIFEIAKPIKVTCNFKDYFENLYQYVLDMEVCKQNSKL
jgi:hypothetical protein